MKKMFFCLLLLPALYVPDAHTIAASLTLHDAVFSPDGESIGVGTDEGFQLLDKDGERVLYSYSMTEGIRFLKWEPDGKRVLVVSWKEQEIPTYSLLDIAENRILFSFPERVRWYYYFATIEDEFEQQIFEEIYPCSTELGHPAALIFSPDGKELAYITEAGSIRIRNAESGALLREFALSDYHATSLGYTSDEERLWVGIILNAPQAFTDLSRLLYLDVHSGEILEKRDLVYDVTIVKGPSLFWVYDMRPDQKYALAVSALYFVSTSRYPDIQHYLVDMDLGKPIVSVANSAKETRPVQHAVFSGTNAVYGLEDHMGERIIEFFDYHNLTLQEYLGEDSIPAHPFAPDGRHFLLMASNRLSIVDSNTLETRSVVVQPTSVEDCIRHEPLEGAGK